MKCEICKKDGEFWCPGGCQYAYCGLGCMGTHWDHGHKQECARLSELGVKDLRFVWAGRDFEEHIKTFTYNRCVYEGEGTSQTYYYDKLPNPVPVDCSAFVQMLCNLGETKSRLYIGNIATRAMLGKMVKGLKCQVIVPRDKALGLKIVNKSPCAAEWVLGPDADGRYLGCGMAGPVRKTRDEWNAFLIANLKKDAADTGDEALVDGAANIEKKGFMVFPGNSYRATNPS